MRNRLSKQLLSLSGTYSKAALQKAYEELSSSYRNHKPFKIQNELQACAYAFARMPATVGVLRDVLSHIKGETITSLLDLGTGPGSALWAQDFDLEKITLVDHSNALMKLGKEIYEGEKAEWKLQNLQAFEPENLADLVILSYVLNELNGDTRKELLLKAWGFTAKFLVLVEPGTPQGFSHIKAARDLLIQQGASILAPCTHEKACPMSESDWCHFKTRIDRSELHRHIKGPLPFEDEKYSYLIASKEPLANRASSRIVKKPLQSKGLVQLDLCNANGLEIKKVSKREGEVYKQARKLKWGDIAE